MEYIKLSRNNQINLTRGDSETYEIGIVINGEEYTPVTGDSVRFAMRKGDMDYSQSRYIYPPILIKDIPIDTMQLTFAPEDTKNLPFGNYVYDVQITFENGDTKTFIKDAPFVIEREVE